jgi:tetratricopeptide (TPR) repeat protein
LRGKEALYTLLAAVSPLHPEPYHQLGHAHVGLGQFARANEDFSAALWRQGSDPRRQAHLLAARAANLLRLKEQRRACADLQQAVALDPEQPRTCNDLAWLYLTGPAEIRAADKALPLARRAVRAAPGNWAYQNTLGVAYYRVGEFRLAAETLERNSKHPKNQSPATDWLFLAMSHRRLGETARAWDYYDRAVCWQERAKLTPAMTDELNAFRNEARAVLLKDPNR